jgi:hypothetical protein
VIGKEFNEIFKNKILIKLTNEAENHNGFQFQTGSVLLYVEIQTNEICLEACKQDIEALKYINENFKPYVISKLKSLKLITSRSGF